MPSIHFSKIVLIVVLGLNTFFSYSLFKKKIVVGITYDMQFAMDSIAKEFVAHNPGIKISIEIATNNELYFKAKRYDVVIFSELDYAKILGMKNVVEKEYVPLGYGHVAFLGTLGKMNAGTNDVKSILLYEEINSLILPKRAISTYGLMSIEYLSNIRAMESLNERIKLRDTDVIIGLIKKRKADYSIIPYSLSFSKELNDNNVIIPLPTNEYTPNLVVATVVRYKKKIEYARTFVNYLRTPSVNIIFKYFGYTENPHFL